MLSEIVIPQAGTGPQVATLQKSESNGNIVQLERVAIDTDQLIFTQVITTSATAATGAVQSCEGKNKIVVKVEYSTNANTAKFYVLLGDFSVTPVLAPLPGVTPVNTADNTGIVTVGYFHGEAIVVDTRGAKQFQLRMATPSSGSVSAWVGSV